MKIKTSELVGPALDWTIAQIEGEDVVFDRLLKVLKFLPAQFSDEGWYKPSEDWAQGGSIIERKRIHLRPDQTSNQWRAFMIIRPHGLSHRQIGPTPLIAAMRCYVISELGEYVDIPEELL